MPTIAYFGITFQFVHVLVSQYVIFIGICFQSFFHFNIIFQIFPHFFPIFCHLFPSLAYDHAITGFIFYINQKIKKTLDEWG